MTDGFHRTASSAEHFHAELSEAQVAHPLKSKLSEVIIIFNIKRIYQIYEREDSHSNNKTYLELSQELCYCP